MARLAGFQTLLGGDVVVEAASVEAFHDFGLARIVDPLRFGQDADVE